MATLEVISGTGKGKSFPLRHRETVVGRDPMCSVVLASRTVSRQHARIFREADGFYVEDLQSVNGTLVNGDRVEKRRKLDDEDRIRIFDIVLRFHNNSPSEATVVKKIELPEDEDDSSTAALDSSAQRSVDQLEQRLEVNPLTKLRAVLEITKNLGSSLDLDEVLPRILDSLFAIFPQADRGYILQGEGAAENLQPRAIKHRHDASDTISPVSNSIAGQVMNEGKAFITEDIADDSRLQEMADSIFDEGVRSVMCAPLMGSSHIPRGVIHLETNEPGRSFVQDDLDVLVSVAFLAGQAVDYTRVHANVLDLDRNRRELAMAKEVQLQFLPSASPKVPGYRFYNYYHAAESVAGDYFDYIEMPDGRLAIAVGDVAGKGMSAALMMARLCSDVRYCLLSSPSPDEAVTRLNRQLYNENQAFVTFMACILDPAAHTLTFVNAGHNSPLRRAGESRTVEDLTGSPGMPLNVVHDTKYEAWTVDIAPGDLVLCYTDGLSEALNPQGKMYGIPAIRTVLSRGEAEADRMGMALVHDVRRFAAGTPQSDDICIICLSRDT